MFVLTGCLLLSLAGLICYGLIFCLRQNYALPRVGRSQGLFFHGIQAAKRDFQVNGREIMSNAYQNVSVWRREENLMYVIEIDRVADEGFELPCTDSEHGGICDLAQVSPGTAHAPIKRLVTCPCNG